MKIILCGNYGAGNLGDQMILEGALEMLKNNLPEAQLTVMSANPKETKDQYAISTIEKFPAGIKSLLKNLFKKNKHTDIAVKNCDYFILGGGGLFGGPEYTANIIWGIQAIMAHKHKKPLIIYGQSIGPLKGQTAVLVKKIFEKASLIAVRDEDSVRELEKLNLHQKIHLIPDLAFRLPPIQISNKRKKTAVVALRQMPRLTREFKENLAIFINQLIDRGFNIKFINFQQQPGSDHALHLEIKAQIKDQTKTEIIGDIKNTTALLEHFSNASLVLAMRLHAIITAIKCATPFIALNYAHKVKAMLKTANFDQYAIDLNQSSALPNLYHQMELQNKSITENLKNYNQQAYKAHLEFEKNFLKSVFQEAI